MAFAETIANLPYTPRTPMASGFVPPMLRSMGHVLYLLGCLNDEQVTVSDEEGIGELTHARDHWNARAETPAVSTAAVATAALIRDALTEAVAEFVEWDADTRTANLRDLSNRIMQYTADLDRELVGIRDSDPGSSL